MSAIGGLKRAVVGMIPEPIAERVLPWKRAAFRAAGVSTTRPEPCRLLIAPVNSAGQGFAWARAAERLPGVAATNFMYRGAEDVFAYPANHSVSTAYFVQNRRWQAAQRRALAKNFTHVLIESGRPILGDTRVDDDIAFLRSRGLEVGLLWHGSDIRRPSSHAAAEPDSPFREDRYAETARLEESALRNHALMGRTSAPVFVSTPDLLTDVPEATWLPVVVDAAPWAAAAQTVPLTRARPVVVHAPSRAGLKGTDMIVDVVRRLDAEGVIEYREVHGVPASRMPEVYGSADIVLDQFSLGIYGVAACEALAGGRIVVSHVSDVVRERVRARTGRSLPVIESRAGELETVLRRIASGEGDARARAAEGAGFVDAVHSGALSARALATFLGVSEENTGAAWETGTMPVPRNPEDSAS